MTFQKATKYQARGRLALCGPSGSGKTKTSLRVAQILKEGGNGRVALIDTEFKSASKYADEFDFDTECLESFAPKNYVNAIHDAESQGYPVIILDCLSHAWAGLDGMLQMHDEATMREPGRNSFTAWGKVNPDHNALIQAIVGSSAHIIATMRSKTAYALEQDEKGRSSVRKLGMKPIQRDGMDYEFDVVCDLDMDLNCMIGKTRCSALKGKVFQEAGENDLGKIFHDWLTDGAPALMGEGELRQMQEAVLARLKELGESNNRLREAGAAVVKSLGYGDSREMPVEKLPEALEAISKWEPTDES